MAFKSIINGVNDEAIIYKIFQRVLEKKNGYGVLRMFEVISDNLKEQCLKLIKEKEKILKVNIIDQYNVDYYLSKFDFQVREHIVKDILFKDFMYDYEKLSFRNGIKLNKYAYPKILSAFKGEGGLLQDSKMFEFLQFLVAENKKIIDKSTGEYEGIPNSDKIINIFFQEGYDVKNVIKFLIESDALDRYIGLDNINKDLPDGIKKEITIFIIDYYKEKLGNFQFYNLIQNLKPDELTELLEKYVVKEKMFDCTYQLSNNRNIESLYNCLYYANLLFSLISDEQFDEYFDKINSALITNDKLPSYGKGYERIIKVYAERYNVSYNGLFQFIESLVLMF